MIVLVLKIAVLLCGIYSTGSWLYSFWRRRGSGGLPYPPGPKGLPLVGNILDIPNAGDLEKARGWKKLYGDVVFFETLGKKFILLNSYEAAFDLFEKRSHNYSSRSHNIVFELSGWDRMPTMMPYCDEHRKSRQMTQRFFGQSVALDHHRLQTQVTHRLLSGLLEGRGDFRDLTRRAVGEAILMIAYGYKVLEDNDPYIDLADRGMRSGIEAEKLVLINVFPWIRYLPEWFPGTAFHRIIKEGREFTEAIIYRAHDMTKKRIYDGSAFPSMTSKLMEAHSTETGDITDEDIIARSTAVVNIAGTDTTVSTLNTLYLTMILYPDTQRRAQEELDSVIGKDNLPTMQDRPNLPYIEAVCNELSRWQPVGPLGIPHYVTDDDVYKGYSIPAGTMIIPNIWAMLRDPLEYPQPEKFMPERWLPTKDGKAPMDVHKVAFGFGRRICPGRYFADSSIFIIVASVLAAFNIERALDAKGVPITPALEYTATFVRHPKPFQCRVTPRSEKTALVIQQAVDSANDPPVTAS